MKKSHEHQPIHFYFAKKNSKILFNINYKMGTKEKKSTIKFQKNKLKGVVKKRKETNKFKRQIVRRQIRRGAPIDPHKGKKKRKRKYFMQTHNSLTQP